MWKIIILVGQLSTGSTEWFMSHASYSTEDDCIQALNPAISEALAHMQAVPNTGVILVDAVCQKQGEPA
ncbi:MAG TPA: hypothetical protein VMS08_05525 [Candidatus Saccharimonadia bacterium]|jgi:hypothetical protein|nr:hypothetical protein [Candidatus Saccharimonadia bacterium]